MITFEPGDFSDNVQAFGSAIERSKSGDDHTAYWMLVELRRHIVASPDRQSKVWLLPKINEAIQAIGARVLDAGTWSRSVQRAPAATPPKRRPWGRVDIVLLRWAAVISLSFTLIKVLSHELPRDAFAGIPDNAQVADTRRLLDDVHGCGP